jgi:hypothetical protein
MLKIAQASREKFFLNKRGCLKREKKTAQNWIFYFFSDRDVNKKRLSSLLRQPIEKIY